MIRINVLMWLSDDGLTWHKVLYSKNGALLMSSRFGAKRLLLGKISGILMTRPPLFVAELLIMLCIWMKWITGPGFFPLTSLKRFVHGD